MTSKEAIRVLEDNRPSVIFEDENAQKRMAELCQAIDMAIEALTTDAVVRCKDCRFAMVRTKEEMNKPKKSATHGTTNRGDARKIARTASAVWRCTEMEVNHTLIHYSKE